MKRSALTNVLFPDFSNCVCCYVAACECVCESGALAVHANSAGG